MSIQPSTQTGFSRRMVQNPKMLARVEDAVRAATANIHKRRLREWSESNEGPFPSLADSRQEAITEVAILCRALDTLVAITPAQISHAVDLLKPPPTWKYFDIDDV